jgi:23S rRNA pseudouridine1911/1915/1917 synthase
MNNGNPTGELVVPAHLDRHRLDETLAELLPHASRMSLRGALDDGSVRVNGEVRAAGWRVSAGDCILPPVELPASWAMVPEPIPLPILYEDEDLVVVDKPAGMVMHPAGRHRSGTLANALAHHFNVAGGADPPIRPGIVHRLDRSTSGLVVVAKTQRALSRLTIQFQNKQVTKRYLALVHGRVEPDAGEWDAPIGANPGATPKWGIREDGRPARSRCWVRGRFSGYTLLKLEPVTGRTNQLRLHAAHFGYPIAGDTLFGTDREQDPPARLFLHACRLELRHPSTGAPLRLETGLPPPLAEFISSLTPEP